jgi:hypothetical protein
MGCCPCAGAGEGAVGLPRAVAPSSRKVVAGGGPPAGGCAHHTNERTTTIDHPSWSLAAAAASNSDPTQRSKPGRQTPFFSIKAPNRLRGHQIGGTCEADLVKSVRTFCFDLDRAGGPFRPPPKTPDPCGRIPWSMRLWTKGSKRPEAANRFFKPIRFERTAPDAWARPTAGVRKRPRLPALQQLDAALARVDPASRVETADI